MTIDGIVQNGTIILDKGATLPEGTRVKVSIEPTEEDCQELSEILLKHAGIAKGLSSDLAEQHDHYLHGTLVTLGGKAVNDPIVDEVRRVRATHAARFNYDLGAIFQDIKEQEKNSGRTFVSFGSGKGIGQRGEAGDQKH
jgi:hypothetical protein